jgi:hypothetical protein
MRKKMQFSQFKIMCYLTCDVDYNKLSVAKSFLKTQHLHRWPTNFSYFVEPEYQLLCLQEPATRLYPELFESAPLPPTVSFFKVNFNSFHTSKLRSPWGICSHKFLSRKFLWFSHLFLRATYPVHLTFLDLTITIFVRYYFSKELARH